MLTIDEVRSIPLFSALQVAELERLAATSADLHLGAGEFAVHEGGDRALYAVLSGKIEVVKLFDGIERTLGWRIPGTIFGEVPIAFGTTFVGGYRASEPSRVFRVDPRQYYTVAAASPEVAVKVGSLARERMGGLQGLAAEAPKARVVMVGNRWDAACVALRQFLARNQISYDWMTPDAPELATRWPGAPTADDDYPALRLTDGTVLRRPATRDVAERLGLQTRARLAEYDTVIIGGGPAGLAAAVYGASEGLHTVVVEREAPGGQAGTSSRIENYLGFPSGVSGDELASRALQQARRLGAEILVTRAVTGIDPATRRICLDGGEFLGARTVILATGVTWRRLDVAGFDRLIGKGIYYGAARSEASATHGLDIHLIGAGNSAGQAALYFANHARSVTLVVRGDSLERSMSRYLIEQLADEVERGGSAAFRSRRRARRHPPGRDRHPQRHRRDGAATRLRRPFHLHRRRRGDRLAAGRHRSRRSRLCPDRRWRGEGRALVAQSRSLPARIERSRDLRLRRRAAESGQARGLGGRRGQHGDRVRPQVPATGGPCVMRPSTRVLRCPF